MHKSIGAGDVRYVRHEGPADARKLVVTTHRVMVTVDLDKLLHYIGIKAVKNKRGISKLVSGAIELVKLT